MRKKTRWKLLLKIFLPSVLGFLILTGAIDAYVVYTLMHPPQRQFNSKVPNKWTEVKPLVWEEISWSSQGTSLKGWVLIRDANLPGIILTHGYGGTREDILDLGYKLWEQGYNVLLCDLRAHGENSNLVSSSSLGAIEKTDLLGAIKLFKTLKYDKVSGKLSNAGLPLIDPQNIGLYGIDVGAYISLMAAVDDNGIKVVVADSPYVSVQSYVHMRINQIFNMNSAIVNSIVDLGMNIALQQTYNAGSVVDIGNKYKAQSKYVMIIAGQDAPLYKADAQKIFNALDPNYSKFHTPALSRQTRFSKEASEDYNNVVCDFIKVAIPLPIVPSTTKIN